jgi:hypothetical protein
MPHSGIEGTASHRIARFGRILTCGLRIVNIRERAVDPTAAQLESAYGDELTFSKDRAMLFL